MKRFILSSIGFFILFVLIFNHFNKVFSSQHHFVNTTNDFKNLAKKTNIDILFIGSSHAYTAFNPLLIDKNCNTISYNLGSDGLRVSLTDLVLEEALKYTQPKLIVLEIYNGSITQPTKEKAKGYQLRALDFVSNFSIKKLKKINRFYSHDEILGVLFPLIRNHRKWNKVDYFDYDKSKKFNLEENFYYRGFIGSSNIISVKGGREKFADFRNKNIEFDASKVLISDESKEDIMNILNIAKDNNIKVLIVSAPDPRARFSNYDFFNQLKSFCDTNNVPFLNMNNYYSEMSLGINDFKDKSHLNTLGSIKASNFLSGHLSKNYKFKNRSDESFWKSEASIYNNFKRLYVTNLIYDKKIDKSLSKNVGLNHIKINQKNKTVEIRVLFDSLKTNFSNLGNYRLGVNVFPKASSENQISERSKKKGNKFDISNVVLKNSEREASLFIETNIEHIDKIKLFLYNKDKYNGVIGKPFWIKGL